MTVKPKSNGCIKDMGMFEVTRTSFYTRFPSIVPRGFDQSLAARQDFQMNGRPLGRWGVRGEHKDTVSTVLQKKFEVAKKWLKQTIKLH